MSFKNTLIYSIVISSILYFVSFSGLHAAEENKSAYNFEGMTKAMQKSMDPNVWSQMMAMMMWVDSHILEIIILLLIMMVEEVGAEEVDKDL